MLINLTKERSVILNVLPEGMSFDDVDSSFLQRRFAKRVDDGEAFVFGAPIVKLEGEIRAAGKTQGVTFKRNDKLSVKDVILPRYDFVGAYSISSRVSAMAYTTNSVDPIDHVRVFNVTDKTFEAPSVNSVFNRNTLNGKVELLELLKPIAYSNVDAYQAMAVNYIYNNSMRLSGWMSLSKLTELQALTLEGVSNRADIGSISINLNELQYDMLGVIVPRTYHKLQADDADLLHLLLERFFEGDNDGFTQFGTNTYASPIDSYWREDSLTQEEGRLIFGSQSGFEINVSHKVNIEALKESIDELARVLNASTSFLFGTKHHTYVHHCTGMLLINNLFFSIEEYGQK